MLSESVNPSGRPDLETSIQAYLADRSPERLRILVESAGGLVHHFAHFYSGDRVSEDLVQAGYEGLLKAIHRYDPERGVKFATYASHCIMGEIRHELRRHATFDRPAWLADLQSRIHRTSDELLQSTGEPPTLEAIAERLNIQKEGVLEALRAGSLILDDIDLSRIRSIRLKDFQLPIEDRITVQQALAGLSNLQRNVVYLIFYQNMTQKQVASELGIAQRRVSRLLHRGLAGIARSLA